MYVVKDEFKVYENVEEFMTSNGVDRHRLKKELCVSNAMMSKYIKGINNITLEKAKVIYNLYGCVLHPYNTVALRGSIYDREDYTRQNNKKAKKIKG